jgi:two-component system sensor histidine kinase BarA
MVKQQTFTPTQPSFRNQLLTFTALGLVIFSLFTSVMIAWLVSGMAQSYMTSNGKQVTEGLSEQSILAVLTESGENAESAINQVMRFPEVSAAKIVLAGGEVLIERGKFDGSADLHAIVAVTEANLVFENDLFWVFAAPIEMDSAQDGDGVEDLEDDEEFDSENVEEQLLGYSVVKMSKQTLNTANESIVSYALLIGVVAVLAFTVLINYGLSKLTQPLLNLAQVMLDSEKTGDHLRAEIEGPKEVQRMAHAYNGMMEVLDVQDEELRLHRDQLEAEVDIRTRELIEARDTALTANRHKSEFLANMTHELRTPIQAIIGYVDLVKEELEIEGLPELMDDLDKVTNNSRRLLTLINSVLDFAKIEAGKMDVNLETIAVSTIILNVKETVLPLVQKNGNSLVLVGDDLDQNINSDREKLEQVLVNLLSNACKFTEKGTVTFDATAHENAIVFSVIDTGIGIEEEDAKTIFEEFQQVDGSQARKFQGTGLGLAICKRFCELIDADISVTSKIGEGSIFVVKVPLTLI